MPEQAQQIEQSYMLERNKIGVEEETDTDAETEEA
jgi:ribosomal protein S24E